MVVAEQLVKAGEQFVDFFFILHTNLGSHAVCVTAIARSVLTAIVVHAVQ